MRWHLFLLLLWLPVSGLRAQFLMDMLDTTKAAGRGLVSLYRRFDHLRVGGYIQAQYQRASTEGAKGYSGGDFAEFSDNRFMIRRGRIRFDYARYDERQNPKLQFVFQFDGTERGVFIRDFWGRLWDKRGMFSLTTGMFARPFGYEVNLSSSDREAPERGRMSQILMRTERDLGAMVSLEPSSRGGLAGRLKLDLGVFNGQGLTATTDFDRYKDIIGQLVLKPFGISPAMSLGGGMSFMQGGLRQFTSAAYRMSSMADGDPGFRPDSLDTRIGSRLPRRYRGMNLQWKWNHAKGATELRAECWKGVQTGTRHSSETPGSPYDPSGVAQPFHVRDFAGGFLLFLQHLGSSRHQMGLKVDWYDPNTRVRGDRIGNPLAALGAADVRYTTLGFGYNHVPMENVRLTIWYDIVRNESTSLSGLEGDLPDDVLTVRIQYRF